MPISTGSCGRALNRILDHEPIALTHADIAWIRTWVPFLLFGHTNINMFDLRPTVPRRSYFVQLGQAVWMVHLALIAAGELHESESTAMTRILETYLVDTSY